LPIDGHHEFRKLGDPMQQQGDAERRPSHEGGQSREIVPFTGDEQVGPCGHQQGATDRKEASIAPPPPA